MNCITCGCSIEQKMLHRTLPKGQNNPGWMCIDCIEKSDPYLANDIKSLNDYDILKDIEEICLNIKNDKE